MRSPAPPRTNPFTSRGQGSPRRALGSAEFASGCECSGDTEFAWPLAGGAPLGGDAQFAAEGPGADELASPEAGGSPDEALINCASVALGACGGGIVPGCRARLRLTT
jgi:hypothetical protein